MKIYHGPTESNPETEADPFMLLANAFRRAKEEAKNGLTTYVVIADQHPIEIVGRGFTSTVDDRALLARCLKRWRITGGENVKLKLVRVPLRLIKE